MTEKTRTGSIKSWMNIFKGSKKRMDNNKNFGVTKARSTSSLSEKNTTGSAPTSMTRSSTTTTQSSVANKTIDHDDVDHPSQPTKNSNSDNNITTTIVDDNPPKDDHEYSVKAPARSDSHTSNVTSYGSVEVNPTVEVFWEHGGQEVFVTGTFDQWNKSLKMEKQPDGRFVANLQSNDKTILYKFVVDGVWKHDGNQTIEKDKDGNINNVLRIQ
ncbi:unnamed protein product [Absidia cylindrospora]